MNYDTIILGSGTAAQSALLQLSSSKRRVAVVADEPLGGTCALFGCQPKKYLVVNSHLVARAKALEGKGVAGRIRTSWKDLQAFMRSFTDAIPASVEKYIASQGADLIRGKARFIAPKYIEVSGERYHAEQYIIATGARPRPFSGKGGEFARSSDDFLSLETLPKNIVFIGGGYISLECAFIAACAGAKVTVLQHGDRILSAFDKDMVDILAAAAAEAGLRIVTNAKVSEIRNTDTSYEVLTKDGSRYAAHMVIGATGRIANTDDLGLEYAEVDTLKDKIRVDHSMRTSQFHIFAVGDCTTTKQLAPISDMEGRIAAANALGACEKVESYEHIPTVLFTDPQLAQVGLREEDIAPNRNIRVLREEQMKWPNLRRMNSAHSAYKVLIDMETDTIEGAQIVHPEAGELINIYALAIKYRIPRRELAQFPWAYPTHSSDIKYTFQMP